MITFLKLKKFKSFKDIEFNFKQSEKETKKLMLYMEKMI